MKFFFDTNILVYLFDGGAAAKQKAARALFKRHTEAGDILLSTQVLQEFYVSVTRKLDKPLPTREAGEAVASLAELPCAQVDPKLVLAAVRRCQSMKLSFWDALILEAALSGGATTLYTEDLQHGFIADGLRIENPLLAKS